MADRKRSAAGLRAKREVLPRQPVNYLAKVRTRWTSPHTHTRHEQLTD